MIGRWIYRSFWAFYDHLGTYVFAGMISALLAVLMIMAVFIGSQITGGEQPSDLRTMMTLWFSGGIPLMILGSAFFPHTRAAVADRPVRWRDLPGMFARYWRRYFMAGLIITLWGVIVHSNVLFYMRYLQGGSAGAGGYVFFVLGNAIGILGLTLMGAMVLGLAELGEVERPFLWNAFKRGGVFMLLQPGLCLCTLFCCLLLCLSAIRFHLIGFILFPLVAMLVSTCTFLVNQYAENLIVARDELGFGNPVRAYKMRAKELGMEWEARQPRRTLREMIKPWE